MWGFAVTLIMLWLMGMATDYSLDYYIDILVFFAIVAMLIKMEDDCSDYGYKLKGKRH